jgi:hypothetical protein
MFQVPFHTIPKVVATPFFHAYDAAAGIQVMARMRRIESMGMQAVHLT